MVTVLIVDDSAFARLSITRQLKADSEIEIIGYAVNGLEALEKVKELKPDVVTLDVEMPRMDGLEALSRIMSENPTPVVMLSSLTDKGTEITVRALEMGAIDFFLKASKATNAGFYGLDNNLNSKIKLAAAIGGARLRMAAQTMDGHAHREKPLRQVSITPRNTVVIGSSTGGPGALYKIIPELPADIPAAVLLVQHMPPGFTKSLANRLNELSNIQVKEAEQGDVLRPGLALLAPGNYHMEVKKHNKIAINQKPAVRGLRPSVDITMLSASLVYGHSTVGVVLTGMGTDGTEGAASIKAAGGKIAVQDEATSVVYGMPRSVAESGYADKVLPLSKIACEIMEMCLK